MAGAYAGRGVTALFFRGNPDKEDQDPDDRFRQSYLIPAGDDPVVGDFIGAAVGENAEEIDVILAAIRYGIVVAVDDPPHAEATKLYMFRFNPRELTKRQIINNARVISCARKQRSVHDE